MKKLLPAVVLLLIGLVATAFTWNRLRLRIDPNLVEFNEDADRLIEGLQQYKEFVKSYPSGNLVEIAKALSGQSEKDRVLILATNRNKKNAKGEIVDPWGSPSFPRPRPYGGRERGRWTQLPGPSLSLKFPQGRLQRAALFISGAGT